MKKLIPADTVDAAGNVWETTGENIRRGAREFSEDSVTEIADILFPVGSIYCGENPYVLSIGTWSQITVTEATIAVIGNVNITGTRDNIGAFGSTARPTIAIRLWKRES